MPIVKKQTRFEPFKLLFLPKFRHFKLPVPVSLSDKFFGGKACRAGELIGRFLKRIEMRVVLESVQVFEIISCIFQNSNEGILDSKILRSKMKVQDIINCKT